MSDTDKAGLPPPAKLFPADFEILMTLLPRAQITVGDVAKILGTLQRLEHAARTKAVFIEDRPSGEPEKG